MYFLLIIVLLILFVLIACKGVFWLYVTIALALLLSVFAIAAMIRGYKSRNAGDPPQQQSGYEYDEDDLSAVIYMYAEQSQEHGTED